MTRSNGSLTATNNCSIPFSKESPVNRLDILWRTGVNTWAFSFYSDACRPQRARICMIWSGEADRVKLIIFAALLFLVCLRVCRLLIAVCSYLLALGYLLALSRLAAYKFYAAYGYSKDYPAHPLSNFSYGASPVNRIMITLVTMG